MGASSSSPSTDFSPSSSSSSSSFTFPSRYRNEDELLAYHHRSEASRYAALRNSFYSESQSAYRRGDGAEAKRLSNKGKNAADKMEKENKKAAYYFYRAFNEQGEKRKMDMIDLHGLHVSESIDAVKYRFEEIEKWNDKIKNMILSSNNNNTTSSSSSSSSHGFFSILFSYFSGSSTTSSSSLPSPSSSQNNRIDRLVIIVGKGLHSMNKQSKLKPAIISLIRSYHGKIGLLLNQPNEGCITVLFDEQAINGKNAEEETERLCIVM